MGYLHIENTLDEHVDIFTLLSRVFVVHIVEIDMHNPHGVRFPDLSYLAGEATQRRVVGNQHPGNVFQIGGIRQPLIQGESHLVALLMRELQRCPARRPVRPDPGSRCFPGDLFDFARNTRQVGIHTLFKLRIRFILPAGFIV